MTTSQTRHRFAALDTVLRPALRGARSGNVRQRALAVLCAGYAHDLKTGLIVAWIRTQSDSALKRYVSTPAFTALAQDARRHVRQPPDPRAAAQRLARVLTPLPDWIEASGPREIKARVAFAKVGLVVLDATRGVDVPMAMNAALLTNGEIGVALSWSDKTVVGALRIVEQARWAHAAARRHRSWSRWVLNPMAPEIVETIEYRHHDLVEALHLGASHPLADLLRLVDHPAISYGPAGMQTAWLVALVDAAGGPVDPMGLGVSKSALPIARRTWRRLIEGSDDVQTALDAAAGIRDGSGLTPLDGLAAAEARRRAASEESNRQRAEHAARTKPVAERMSIRLPDGYDPTRHEGALLSKVAAAHGPGWVVLEITVSVASLGRIKPEAEAA